MTNNVIMNIVKITNVLLIGTLKNKKPETVLVSGFALLIIYE